MLITRSRNTGLNIEWFFIWTVFIEEYKGMSLINKPNNESSTIINADLDASKNALNLSLYNPEHFQYSATAQLVVDPIADAVIAVNQELCRLLDMNSEHIQYMRVSQLFIGCFPTFIVFTEEIISRGKAWSDQLLIETQNGEERVEVNGLYEANNAGMKAEFSLQRIIEIDQHREHSDDATH